MRRVQAFERLVTAWVPSELQVDEEDFEVALFLGTCELERHNTLADYRIAEGNTEESIEVRRDEIPALVDSSDGEP